MKVKISYDYGMWEQILKYDRSRKSHGEEFTEASQYHHWEEKEVDFDQLKELISQGHAILINC